MAFYELSVTQGCWIVEIALKACFSRCQKLTVHQFTSNVKHPKRKLDCLPTILMGVEFNTTEFWNTNPKPKTIPIFVTCHSLKGPFYDHLPEHLKKIACFFLAGDYYTFPLLQISFPHFLGTKSFRKNHSLWKKTGLLIAFLHPTLSTFAAIRGISRASRGTFALRRALAINLTFQGAQSLSFIKKWDHFGTPPKKTLPSRERIHIPPKGKKEKHLQNWLFTIYVSSLEGNLFDKNAGGLSPPQTTLCPLFLGPFPFLS